MHEHQRLVAKQAKNNTDDLEEIEGRKYYRVYESYNKFLRMSLLEHMEKFKLYEKIYIELRKITVRLCL